MAITRTTAIRIRFKWDGVNWTDETQYFLAANGALEQQPPHEAYVAGKQIIQQASVRLANKNNRFSTWHSSSVLYAYRATGGPYHAPCEIAMQINSGAWDVIFSGYVKSPVENFAKSEVSFSIWDIGEVLRAKYSCPMLQNYMEHEVVVYYLQLAGLVDGTDFISPAYAESHSVTATIDYSTTRIPYSWLDDEPIWDELADIAQASGARIYATRDGKVKFEKGYRWATGGSSETVTPDQYADFVPQYDDKAFYDEVIVEYSERVPGDAEGELWKLEKPLLIYPGTTETIEARLRYPAISILPPTVNKDYFVRSLGGLDKTASTTITYTYAASKVTVAVANTSTDMTVLSKMSFKGTSLVGQPSKQVKRATGANNYDRQLSVRGNPYLQSRIQAEGVADFLAWWHATVKPVWQVKGLRGVPTRALGDRMTIKADGQTLAGIITRIDWTLGVIDSGGAWGFKQDVQLVQDVFNNGDTYFRVGISLLNGSDGVWF